MSARTWRKVHRYLGLVIGVQLLLWTVSGLVFSWNTIKSVRGEATIRIQQPVDLSQFELKNPGEIANAAEQADGALFVSAKLRMLLSRPVYEMAFVEEIAAKEESDKQREADETAEQPDTEKQEQEQPRISRKTVALFDAVSGECLSPIDEETAKAIALADFSGTAEIESVERFTEVSSHSEYRGKELPAYRVVLNDPTGTAIWVSTDKGIVTTRRNNQWRLFDFFFMVHTMDYQGRDNFNTWILKAVSIFGVITVLSGFGLWFKTTRLFRKRRKGVRSH